jgi:hypothetical protein
MNEIKNILARVNSIEYVDGLDAGRKEKVLDWVNKVLPKLLGNFFVPNEAKAASILLRVTFEMTLPPADPKKAQEKLAAAILECSKVPKTNQYDVAKAMKFLNDLIDGYSGFVGQLSDPDGPMLMAIARGAGDDIAAGIVGLLNKLNVPLFTPMLTALKRGRGVLMEKGSQTVDQLLIKSENPEPEGGQTSSTRRITSGAQAVNAWLKDNLEQGSGTAAVADIFPEDILASEQFMRPFEYGNDPASPQYARNAQRMLVYTDSHGSVKGMFVTGTEVESYGTMIRNGALKNAYFMDVRGHIDPEYLPPTCEEGALPKGDPVLDKIQAQCSRFALYMRIYNGSVGPETLDRDLSMKDVFQRDILENPQKKSALIAFLGAKTPDTTWVDRIAA